MMFAATSVIYTCECPIQTNSELIKENQESGDLLQFFRINTINIII